MSLPHLTKTRSAGSKPFPADRWKRQNERPGRFDTCIVAIFNGDQFKKKRPLIATIRRCIL